MHHHHGPPRHRARRGAIKGSVVRLLAERPMHGYELIGEFEERTGGRWRPSPGSVYPILAQLEDEGLVRSFDDEGRKRFELTDAGRAWLDEHADDDQSPPWERSGVGRRGEPVNQRAVEIKERAHLWSRGTRADLRDRIGRRRRRGHDDKPN